MSAPYSAQLYFLRFIREIYIIHVLFFCALISVQSGCQHTTLHAPALLYANTTLLQCSSCRSRQTAPKLGVGREAMKAEKCYWFPVSPIWQEIEQKLLLPPLDQKEESRQITRSVLSHFTFYSRWKEVIISLYNWWFLFKKVSSIFFNTSRMDLI